MDNSSSSGMCTFCALTLCETCSINKKLCHRRDHGRSICSFHTKNNHALKIESNRILACKNKINMEESEISKILEPSSLNNLFGSFYSEINGNAHYFEVFDCNDTSLWKGFY